ncbi:hypothetical protein PAECIP111890_04514 [Paenibacillus sp. JJ-223]|nr:hypothetical protein PAECIP111890_04514 [Paenibacillus sp. JJ-223]
MQRQIQFLFHDLAIGQHVQIQFFQFFFGQQFHEIHVDLLQIHFFALDSYPVSIQHYILVHIGLQHNLLLGLNSEGLQHTLVASRTDLNLTTRHNQQIFRGVQANVSRIQMQADASLLEQDSVVAELHPGFSRHFEHFGLRLLKNRSALHLFAAAPDGVNGHRLLLRSAREVHFDSCAFLRQTVKDIVAFARIGKPPIGVIIMLIVDIQMNLHHVVCPFDDAPFQGPALKLFIPPGFTSQALPFDQQILISQPAG